MVPLLVQHLKTKERLTATLGLGPPKEPQCVPIVKLVPMEPNMLPQVRSRVYCASMVNTKMKRVQSHVNSVQLVRQVLNSINLQLWLPNVWNANQVDIKLKTRQQRTAVTLVKQVNLHPFQYSHVWVAQKGNILLRTQSENRMKEIRFAWCVHHLKKQTQNKTGANSILS